MRTRTGLLLTQTPADPLPRYFAEPILFIPLGLTEPCFRLLLVGFLARTPLLHAGRHGGGWDGTIHHHVCLLPTIAQQTSQSTPTDTYPTDCRRFALHLIIHKFDPVHDDDDRVTAMAGWSVPNYSAIISDGSISMVLS